MLRGTGIDGLQGPHKKRNLGKGYVIRPFLNISKKDIMQYLELNKIKYKGYFTLESTRGKNAKNSIISNLSYLKNVSKK